MTWISAAEFCNKVSEAERLQPYYESETSGDKKVVTVPDPAGNGYRLPTEAEWEYACRAGSTGSIVSATTPHSCLPVYAVFRRADYRPREAASRSRSAASWPNAWGLYDMHGNVQEWCQDWYGPYLPLPPNAGPLVDPKGPQTGETKVYRGGSYLRFAKDCRCAVRLSGDVLGTQDDFCHAGSDFELLVRSRGHRMTRLPPRRAATAINDRRLPKEHFEGWSHGMSADERSVRNSLAAAQHAQVDRVCTAFEVAWRRGQTPALEDSLRGFDAPQPVRELLFAELLALEVHYRRSRHQMPNAADYQARFPEYGEQIAQVFQKPPAAAKTAHRVRSLRLRRCRLRTRSAARTPRRRRIRGKQRSGTRPPSPDQPKRLGRYEVLRELGRGAFGCVYLGRDPQLDRQVAIKVARRDLFASEDSAARFLSEARKAAQVCKHPGIVTLYDVQRQGDTYYLVMDYVEGGTLDDPATTAKLTQAEIVELVARVAEAVHFAHTHGLVHCDLKPANILIDGNGDPKVADFGLAVLESEQSHRKGERSGTPKYMSPEQVQGHVERLDGRTDIWSLGATLYELLTRRPPFSGETRAELFDQILHRDVKPPRQINDKIPAALERICLKALSKQPADRYSTARDLRAGICGKRYNRPRCGDCVNWRGCWAGWCSY